MTTSLSADAEITAELLAVTRDLLADRSGVEHVKARIDAGTAHDPQLWAALAETGLLGALAPEELGGAGLTPAHLAGVLQAFGEFAVAEPFLESAVLAVPLLAAAGDAAGDTDGEAGQWVERIAAGTAVASVDVELEGVAAAPVAFAADADIVLRVPLEGPVTLHTAESLMLRPADVLDPLRPAAHVTYGDGVALDLDAVDVARLRDRAVAGSACLLAGVARALLSTTVEYVSVRHQFGRAVGSFQAVKHKIADVAVKVDMAEAAALSAFEGADDATAASTRRSRAAKAYAGAAADLANVEALQLHGGIGFTWEYHLHVWLKRAMSLAAAHGTTTEHRRLLAAELLVAREGA